MNRNTNLIPENAGIYSSPKKFIEYSIHRSLRSEKIYIESPRPAKRLIAPSMAQAFCLGLLPNRERARSRLLVTCSAILGR